MVLESVTPVESLGTEVTRKWHLPAVYEHVLLQVMLHSESLGTLGTCEGSGGVLSRRVVLVGAVRGGVNLV